jgi:hypothetical protein
MSGRIASAAKAQWGWIWGYSGSHFSSDLVAAIVVTILLVPQSLAYALLAGLPPKVGIYASITPLLAYAVLGSSRQLNVGPTAVISLMTAATISGLPEELRIVGAAALALMVVVDCYQSIAAHIWCGRRWAHSVFDAGKLERSNWTNECDHIGRRHGGSLSVLFGTQ